MNLYNGYCYPTIQEVADQMASEPFIAGASEVFWFQTSSSSGNNATLNLVKKTDVSGLASVVGTFSRTMPTCTAVGPYPATGFMSGLILSDSIELSWLVIGVWTVAFAFRAMRRPIR